jgi:hypothetical protein
MQGLLNSLEIGKPFPIEDLNDTSVATIITTHKTLVDGIPVDFGPNQEKDSVKYIIKLGWLEYTLKGIADVYTDILVDIRNDVSNKDMFSLREIDIKKAYLYLKVLEANIDRFPYYRNVIRSYINVFFGDLLRQKLAKACSRDATSTNVLITNNFYLTHHYELGATLSSMHGNFVIGHLLEDMNPAGVAILYYIYKYTMDTDVVPNIKFRDKGFEFELKDDFSNAQINYKGWNTKNREVSLSDFTNKFTDMKEQEVLPYLLESLCGYLDDRGVVSSIVGLFHQAIAFNKQQKV